MKSEKGVVEGEEEEKDPGEEGEDEDGEVLEGFSPRPYTLPNTPSSVRTEHQSSGWVATYLCEKKYLHCILCRGTYFLKNISPPVENYFITHQMLDKFFCC